MTRRQAGTARMRIGPPMDGEWCHQDGAANGRLEERDAGNPSRLGSTVPAGPSSTCAPPEELRDLGGVLRLGVMGPQRAPQAQPGGSVTGCDSADHHARLPFLSCPEMVSLADGR